MSFDAKTYGAAYRAANREKLRVQSAKCYAERKDIYLARQRERRAALTPEQRKAKDALHWRRAKAKQTERERRMQRERAARLRATNAEFAERQRAGHRAWIAKNRDHCRLYAKAQRDGVTPYYAGHLLGLPSDSVPMPLVDLVRCHIQLKRLIRNKHHEQNTIQHH